MTQIVTLLSMMLDGFGGMDGGSALARQDITS